VDISLLQDHTADPPLVLAMLQDITGYKTAVGELRETQSKLEKLAHRLIQVQDDERSRISRELHDDIGQRLSLFGIELDLLGRSLTKLGYDRKGEQAALLHSQVNEIISDLHDLSHALHSTKLQHLGLRAALRDLCNRISQRHKVAMELSEEGGMRLPSEVNLCFYRVAQEALNNVLRHSAAEQVFVTLSISNGIAQLSIKDTGIGFDTSIYSQGIGLLSMRERLRMMGGEFELESAPGKGTEVTARLHLPVEGAASQGTA
jgi:signal transduction histidine kinase